MQYRPWPIIVLALLHGLEPVFKILFYSVTFMVSPLHIIMQEVQSAPMSFLHILHLFSFFFLFPIAGFAIYKVKKWSIPVFIAIEVLVFVLNLEYFMVLLKLNHYGLIIWFLLFGIMNALVVVFLLMPAIKVAYVDPKLRWWEARPRYSTDISCICDDTIDAKILNMSQTGVFIHLESELKIDSTIKLNFSLGGDSFSGKGRVIHKFSINGKLGYGVQLDLSNDCNRKMKNFINYLDNQGAQRRPPKRNINDFKNWLITLIKTGKGLLPSKE